jgi:hypothetical protein
MFKSLDIGTWEKWSHLPPYLFNLWSGPIEVISYTEEDIQGLPYPNLRRCLKAPQSHRQWSSSIGDRFVSPTTSKRVIDQQVRMMRLKMIRLYKIQESPFEETSYLKGWESSHSSHLDFQSCQVNVLIISVPCLLEPLSFRKSRDEISFKRGGLSLNLSLGLNLKLING